jgi:dynein intermediate chain 1
MLVNCFYFPFLFCFCFLFWGFAILCIFGFDFFQIHHYCVMQNFSNDDLEDGDAGNGEPKPDAIQLTDEELAAEFSRSINAMDAKAPKKLSRFNFKDGQYKDDSMQIDYTTVHFALDGTIAVIGSDEARPVPPEALNLAGITSGSAAPTPRSALPSARKSARGTSTDDKGEKKEGDVEAPAEGDAAEDGEEENVPKGPAKVEKNQFSFADRQAQTFNYGMKEHTMMTEPAPVGNLCASATQWSIFDSYLQIFLAAKKKNSDSGSSNQAVAAVLPGRTKSTSSHSHASTAASADPMERLMLSLVSDPSFGAKVKTLERLVNQNSEEHQYHAYKYFDDPADADKEDGTGSLMPLFTFSYEPAKKRTVTSLVWNPKYSDLFAAGYGSYDALSPNRSGMIACFSLKNPSHPEYVFTTKSGVMCLDFHPQHPALLACGFFDGNVAVFDVRSKKNEPIYFSSDPKTRHSEPVWSVKFQPEEGGQPLNFVSVSSDGRVTNWFMNKSELIHEEIMELKLVPIKAPSGVPSADSDSPAPAAAASGPANVAGLAAGSCLDFCPLSQLQYVVGTEQGAVHRCSTAFTSNYLQTFDGHSMAVYSIAWNRFHPRVFLSCSADWTVKVWEANTARAMMDFDLGTSVGDVNWSPYSSTVFAACTSDGKVFVFDLAADKYNAVAEYKYSKLKAEPSLGATAAGPASDTSVKCTRVSFNPRSPVLLVGDDRGVITSFKLSPNLRKATANGWGTMSQAEQESQLEKLLVHAIKNKIDL